MKRSIILVLILALLAVNCSEDPISSKRTSQIWPLATGKSWTGTAREYDRNGTFDSTYQASFAAVHDTLIEGERWYMVEVTLGDPETNDPIYTMLLTNRSSGLWADLFFDPDGNDADGIDPIFWMKYPASVGESYLSGSDSIEVVADDSEINAANNKFECFEFHYLRPPSEDEAHHFACPNVGLVKFEIVAASDNGTNRIWVLDSIVTE